MRSQEECCMPSDESPAHGAARLRRLFRALQARNYRLYVAGQSLSLMGTWMHRMALSWWGYQSTHSALALGVVSGAGQLPGVLLAPLIGALVDRWDRHRLLVVTQMLAMLQALGLACVGLYPGPRYPPAADRGESPGHAVSDSDAGVCDGYAAWGCAHAREAGGGVWRGGDPRSAVSGVPGQWASVRPGARAVDGPLWA